MKNGIDKYMLEPANPVGSGDIRDPIGLTKLEYAVVHIVIGMQGSESRYRVSPMDTADIALDMAKHALRACHEAQGED